MLEGLCARVAAAHVPTMSQIASTLDYSFLSRISAAHQKLQALGTQDDQRSRSLPHKSLVNSAPVLFTDHPAPTSEFSTEEKEEEEEEVNSSSTSRGDLDSDPAACLLSLVLIR